MIGNINLAEEDETSREIEIARIASFGSLDLRRLTKEVLMKRWTLNVECCQSGIVIARCRENRKDGIENEEKEEREKDELARSRDASNKTKPEIQYQK